MYCKKCIYFDHKDHCGKHVTNTEPNWRCASGIEQDNRTPEEVEESIAKLQAEKEAIWKPNFGPEEPTQDGGTALLDSTFGMPAMEMLDELIGSYKIDSSGKLEDPVNHPSHYTDGSIEVIDFIEDKKLGYHLGNSVKYICRAGKKDPTKTIEDLKKAIWYINRHIKTLEK